MKHFTLEELTHTNSGLKNVPEAIQVMRLNQLVDNILDPLRELYGKPITINSGYRSLSVNNKIGGAATSQHCKGEAADIDSENNALLFKLIRDNFTFDQLINENNFAWVHVSFHKEKNRGEILEFKNGKYIKV